VPNAQGNVELKFTWTKGLVQNAWVTSEMFQ